MDLDRLQAQWDSLGEEDPFWAILSDPAKRGNRWDEEEFFATGRNQVARLLARGVEQGVEIGGGRALDFGCGAGRLTQALADNFDEVCGVDIAPSMIDLAQRLNRHGERCRYVVNDRPDLSRFEDGSFDFILSYIVLQHMEPAFAKAYVREFVRLLAPGGVLVFQLPSEPRATVKGQLLRLLSRPPFRTVLAAYRRRRDNCAEAVEMHGVRRQHLVRLVEEAGGEVLATVSDGLAGRTWNSYEYWVRRPRSGATAQASARTPAAAGPRNPAP